MQGTGTDGWRKPSVAIPLLVMLALIAAIGATGLQLYRHFDREIRQGAGDLVTAVAQQKAQTIELWLNQQAADASAYQFEVDFRTEVARLVTKRDAGAALRIQGRLATERWPGDSVLLLDGQGAPLIETAELGEVSTALRDRVRAAATTGSAQMHFLHRDEDLSGSPIFLDYLVPLTSPEGGGAPLAVLVLRHDPHKFFFPLVQAWPGKSASAETLLVRREGGQVLFLNTLRHRADAAFRLARPRTEATLPAAQAVFGLPRLEKNFDHRGIEVVYDHRPIGDTGWQLVAKIDAAEILDSVRDAGATALAVTLTLILLVGASAIVYWRQQLRLFAASRQAAELERKSLSKHLDLMSRHANDAIFLYDEAGRILEANERAVERYGYSRDELIGMSASRLRAPGTLDDARAQAQRAEYAGSRVYETAHRRKDGSEFPVEASIWVVEVEGRRFTQGIIRDITKRKSAQDAVLRERNFINAALESLPGLFYLIDDQGRFLRWNKNFETVSGYSPEEISQLSPTDFFAEPDKGVIAERIKQVFLTGEATAEADFVAKDRTKVPYFFTGRLVQIDRKPCLVGMGIDITARKRAEATLRQSTRVLLESQRVARLGSYRTELDSGAWESSAVLDEIFGITDPAYRRDVTGWLTIVHPDQRDEMAAYFTNEVLGKRRSFDREYRIVRLSDGEERWVHGLGELMANPDGRIVAMIGTIQDITERKLAEEQLSLQATALDAAANAILITDRNGTIQWVNRAFTALTGYSAEEAITQNPRILKSGRHQPEFYRRIFETILAGSVWQGEIVNRYKDGRLVTEEMTITPVLDRSGEITNFIAIKQDITARKQAEARIERLSRMKDALSGVNNAIVHAEREQPLFDEICEIMVNRAGFESASIGFADAGTGDVKWLAYAGAAGAVIAKARRSVRADRPEGRGPTGTAIREGHHVVCQDFANDPSTAPWHAIGIELGIGSTGSFPITRAGRAVGAINVNSRTRNAFDDEIVALLDEAAQDMSFALDNLDREARRKEADERVRRLNRVYAVLSGINSLIVRVRDRDELFAAACRIAVEAGEFRMAWLGIVDRKAMQVTPVAWHGTGADYIQLMPVRVGEDGLTGRGLSGQAVAERRAIAVDDMTQDPRILLKKEAAERGFRSLVIMPLLVAEEVAGVLALYAGEVGFFDQEEMKLLNELAGDISFALDHIEKAGKLDYLAFYDQLTGLANRALFLERVNQSIHAAGQSGSKFTLAMLDIERLRTINESLGRQAGDELIRLVAQRLKTCGGPAGAARISADHFALVLGEVRGRSQAARIVGDALRQCFSEPFNVNGTDLRLSAKAGIALFPGDGGDAETLLANGEAALRKAKDLGERLFVYTPALSERTTGQLTLENQLRQALEKGEFVLHYQPKVDLATRRIVGVEALIRWQSPELGLVPPAKFIPLMEETGLILDAGAWALRQAAADHRKWVEQGLAAPRVAVNVSAIQLRQRDFVAALEQAITQGIAPTGIDLEITESLIMEDVQGSIEKLKAVRGLGVSIAIDDFGTGYSSLGYLAKLPVQALKIDGSFVVAMLNDPDTMTLVQTIISLAHSLKLTVVAEGVEQEEQAKMLHLLRCNQMQGYLFSRPVPFDQVTALLTAENKV